MLVCRHSIVSVRLGIKQKPVAACQIKLRSKPMKRIRCELLTLGFLNWKGLTVNSPSPKKPLILDCPNLLQAHSTSNYTNPFVDCPL